MLRRAQPPDETAIAQLHTDSWRSAYRGILRDEYLDGHIVEDRRGVWSARFGELSRADQLILVSEEGGQIQGFACVFYDADTECGSLLDNLHVLPGLKGKGLGRELMRAAAEHVQRHATLQLLHLWVYERNNPARRFYERLGGAVTACIAERTPDGSESNILRYVWGDLSILTGRAGTVQNVD